MHTIHRVNIPLASPFPKGLCATPEMVEYTQGREMINDQSIWNEDQKFTLCLFICLTIVIESLLSVFLF